MSYEIPLCPPFATLPLRPFKSPSIPLLQRGKAKVGNEKGIGKGIYKNGKIEKEEIFVLNF